MNRTMHSYEGDSANVPLSRAFAASVKWTRERRCGARQTVLGTRTCCLGKPALRALDHHAHRVSVGRVPAALQGVDSVRWVRALESLSAEHRTTHCDGFATVSAKQSCVRNTMAGRGREDL